MKRRGYPSDVDDDTYLFLLPYLLLSPLEASQRKYAIREVLNALLWVARTGAQWAYLPHDFPPAETVRQQAHRWFEAGCFENAAHDLRLLCRIEKTRNGEPSAIIIDSRTLQSTPESGHRAGYDGAKKRKGTKVWAGPKSWTVSSRDSAQIKGTTLAFSSCPGDGLTATFAVGSPQRGSAGRPLACSANSSGVW